MKDEKRKQAIALSYKEADYSAPVVSAKGSGYMADAIIEKGKINKIPIYEDAAMIEALSKLSVNEMIPIEMYEVVAELFSFVYQLDKSYGKKITENKD